MISRRTLVRALMAAGAVPFVSNAATSQTYPDRPIMMIVPFPPGGPIDVMGRLMAERMSQGLGQRVVLENRPGAGASIGSKAAATADPDGYTLLFGSSGSLAVTPVLYQNAGYDPVKSFAPVAAVSIGTLLLAVHPSVPANSVNELVAYAKANPGKMNYGSGIGTPPHIAWGLFKLMTGTESVYIPYKGAAPAITDLLAGQLHFIIDAPGVLLPHIEQGKLRALAVTSAGRSTLLPTLPTMVESGYPDFVMTFWTGVVAPAGTSAPIIDKLNSVINKALGSTEMKTSFAKFRVEPNIGSPGHFAAFVAAEAKKWSKVITEAGIKLD